ncbi:MAG: HD domain-containing protein [Bacteroidales bacterium]|jgi:HD superfamily phosphohydrolase|nr:HD domain-containing protein [Bacteroidales bacterium]
MENKRKIINDPVFGFINIPTERIYRLIQHPYFQRLSRIKQLGVASFVYPGGQHTRFQHSLGAMHLTNEAIHVLRTKGHEITPYEAENLLIAILLHDIGHGPFSHVLEYSLVKNIHHETISQWMMKDINNKLGGELDLALDIFNDRYPKRFLHQLISSQLDMDRLDYLRRDSFFTGVTEGNIGSARIIKMLNVKDDRLVVEAKGIYSIENFLTARRLMYWQVYLHKTAVAAEKMLVNTLLRAKELAQRGEYLFASPALTFFLYRLITEKDFADNSEALSLFALLDDSDIWCALKAWTKHSDRILALLSRYLINRQVFKIEISNHPFDGKRMEQFTRNVAARLAIPETEAHYFVCADTISTNMYNREDDRIDILFNDGTLKDISEASDMLNISLLSKEVRKYYFCYVRINDESL